MLFERLQYCLLGQGAFDKTSFIESSLTLKAYQTAAKEVESQIWVQILAVRKTFWQFQVLWILKEVLRK